MKDQCELTDLRKTFLKKGDLHGLKALNKNLLEQDCSMRNVKVRHYPINVQLEITSKCNARCIMCSHNFTKNHFCSDLEFSDIAKLENVYQHIEKLTLHGYGEPFLHSSIKEALSYFSSFRIKLTCNTNASIMDRELARIIHHTFYNISVSCDASTQYTYESIRKGLKFDRFKRNLCILREGGRDLHIRMVAVAMRQNLQELPGIVELAAEYGINEVLVVDLTPQRLLDNKNDCIRNFPATARYYIEKAKETAQLKGIPIKLPEITGEKQDCIFMEDENKTINETMLFKPEKFSEYLYDKYRKSGYITPTIEATKENFLLESRYHCEGICDFVLERPFIDKDGNLFLCCTNWMHIIGNVFEEGFDSVWNGEIMQGIRDMFYRGSIPKYCVGCIFLRNDMMVRRMRILDMDNDFYSHNYDEQVEILLKDFIGEGNNDREKA